MFGITVAFSSIKMGVIRVANKILLKSNVVEEMNNLNVANDENQLLSDYNVLEMNNNYLPPGRIEVAQPAIQDRAQEVRPPLIATSTNKVLAVLTLITTILFFALRWMASYSALKRTSEKLGSVENGFGVMTAKQQEDFYQIWNSVIPYAVFFFVFEVSSTIVLYFAIALAHRYISVSVRVSHILTPIFNKKSLCVAALCVFIFQVALAECHKFVVFLMIKFAAQNRLTAFYCNLYIEVLAMPPQDWTGASPDALESIRNDTDFLNHSVASGYF